ncbi:serine/threonine-protein kinase [Nannocystaceae bacterium ST9]
MNQAQPQAPRRIGDYVVHRLIGHGGMGEVYEAEEQLTRRRVAIKILHADLGRSAQGRRQFVGEMSILASLDDPHVVRCLHCAEIEGQLIMVLEYLEGQTLRDVIKQRGALPWTEVAGIAWQIAAALRAAQAHRPAIVHRDLKPENTMCLPDGRVKVMDFGIAKVLETMAGTTTSQSLGTLQYMSPEQIDAKLVDGRSDLFSLGLVMWELLAGRPPFVADSPRLLLDKLCSEPTPSLPEHVRAGLPPRLEALIFRLLQKNPDARPRDAGEVIAALDSLRGVQPSAPAYVSAPMPAPPRRPPAIDTIAVVERATRGQAGPRWVVPLAIVGVLALLGLLATVAWIVLGPRSDAGRGSQASASDEPNSSSIAAPASTPEVCSPELAHWPGTWTIRTIATAAPTSSGWIGGKGLYELTLRVEGCRLVGSGHKEIQGRDARPFVATGEVSDEGVATIDYDVTGRDIQGTWTLGKDGRGTWRSGPVEAETAGTLTITRGSP